MKRICLTVIGLYIGLLSAFTQVIKNEDSSQYKRRKLKVEEINLVSSYYHQEGSHAAVTGGIGSQKLTDISTSFDIKLNKWDKKKRKHTWVFELGVDHYTSASSDMIDPKTISSASSADLRVYPSINWSRENEENGRTIGAGVSNSVEYDYQSYGANFNYGRKFAEKNSEYNLRFQALFDRVAMIIPEELRGTGQYQENGFKPRNSFSASFSYSKVINRELQIMVLMDGVYQQGYLGLPFNRVYFDDGSVHVEDMPDKRIKIPVGIRANYFWGDRIILRTFYRYYWDDWGLSAHTASVEVPVKINPFFSISPFYRFYTQTAADHFAPYQQHHDGEEFYTSNYDLSKFNSHNYGLGIRLSPAKGVFGISKFNMIEIRYGYYARSNDLQANIVSMNLRFK